MAIAAKTVRGIAWAAAGSWVQLAISLATFGIVAGHLSAGEIGTFGIVMLVTGLAEMLTGAPLGESLQQRRDLARRHADATFWATLAFGSVAALGASAAAGPVAAAFEAPAVAALLPWAALGLPLATAATVPSALLVRELRFDALTRAGGVAAALSAAIVVAGVLWGFGVWSLLAGDLAGRVWRLVALWRAARYRPGTVRNITALGDLARFNVHTLTTYVLGFADRQAPRLLTGLLLGTAALGYLVFAGRILELLSRIVRSAVASVAMAAVARVQDDRAAVQRLVVSLYRMASLAAYPAFIGAFVLAEDAIALFGDKWVPALLATQILLLVGLRTTTGMFNVAILRGLGHSGLPLILLGTGLALNCILVPIGAAWGVAGVAAAMLVRMLATWPLGAWFIAGTTGTGIAVQALAGAGSLAAAVAMGVVVHAGLGVLPDATPAQRLTFGALLGIASYVAVLASLYGTHRRTALAAAALLMRGDRRGAFARLGVPR